MIWWLELLHRCICLLGLLGLPKYCSFLLYLLLWVNICLDALLVVGNVVHLLCIIIKLLLKLPSLLLVDLLTKSTRKGLRLLKLLLWVVSVGVLLLLWLIHLWHLLLRLKWKRISWKSLFFIFILSKHLGCTSWIFGRQSFRIF